MNKKPFLPMVERSYCDLLKRGQEAQGLLDSVNALLTPVGNPAIEPPLVLSDNDRMALMGAQEGLTQFLDGQVKLVVLLAGISSLAPCGSQ